MTCCGRWGPPSGRRPFQGARANNAIPRDARTVLLLDKPGRTTLDRVAADVHEGSALGVLARTTKRSSRSSQRTESTANAGERRPMLLAGSICSSLSLPLCCLWTSGCRASFAPRPTWALAYIEDDEALLVSAPRSSRRTDLDALHRRYASFARLGGGGPS